MMSKEEAHSLAMSIATGPSLFMVLKAVIELNVLEIINRAGPEPHLSAAQIVAQLSTENPDAATVLDRMLRLLATESILTSSLRTLDDGRVENIYGPGPVSEFFTRAQCSGAMLLLGLDQAILNTWGHLKDTVLNGGTPFEKAYGMKAFEYLGTNTRFNKVFNDAMSSYSSNIVEKMLENYKGFDGVSTLVDVGGGIGTTLRLIISKYPNIKGINFDLPHVIQNAPTSQGIEHLGGDMFVSVPKGDAIFMKSVCHDWSDELCEKMLKNCYVALPENGKVIVCEFVISLASESNYSAKVALNFDARMMLYSVGAKERTHKEFEMLARRAGFRDFILVCSAYDFKVMEFLKN